MSKELRAALRAFDQAINASPGNAQLKAARANVEREAADLPALRRRLAAVEAEMERPAEPRRAQQLLRARDRLLAEIKELA